MTGVHSSRLEHAPFCPDCRAVLDGFTYAGPEGVTPTAGDLTWCAYCHALLMFQPDGSLALTNVAAELPKLPPEDRESLLRSQMLIARMPRRVPPRVRAP